MDSIYTLIERAQKGDPLAKEQILQENSGLIWNVVKHFRGRGEQEDLYQIGAIGLLKCIEKFDFSFGVKFSTYAVPMIMGEIKRFLRDDGAVKVSRSIKELAYRARKVQEDFIIREGRESSMLELAELLDEEIETIILALESIKEVQSLYSNENHAGADHKIQWIDQLEVPSEDEKILDSVSLQKVLNILSVKERQIIVLRYFQDKTQTEIANKIGISQVQVSRMEKKILQQMRDLLQ